MGKSAKLEIQDLQAMRGDFLIDVPRLEIRSGEIFSLMGASGSGKSSLLDAISGFLPLKQGTVFLEGRRIDSMPPEERGVGYVFQKAALFPHLTVGQNLDFPLKIRKIPAESRRKDVKDWLERVGIASLADRFSHQISGGEAQRASLARALIAKPGLLLLDEPFSALDVALRSDLRSLLAQLVKEQNASALLVTHDPQDAKILSSNVGLIEKGKLLLTGS
jgi:ABC-type Fe3+/spermidine/putrescine transport system ATPase subunit